MFDYETMRLIWWALLGVLLMGFAVTDGYDLGSASLLPYVGRNDTERRQVLNTIGPFWEGNQVWLILGGGAMFAAWPYLYAIAFSGFYLAMFAVLSALILRPVSITFRGKMPDKRWRLFWDWAFVVSGTVPPVIFGVAFGNALQGVPFMLDDTMRMTYYGSFFQLLNPYALLCGVISLSMIWMQGATWLAVKTDAAVHKRACQVVVVTALVTPVLFTFAGLWAGSFLDGYRIVSEIDPNGLSNPLLKTVERARGVWMNNYTRHPVTLLVPFLVAAGSGLALWGIMARRHAVSFIGSSLVQIGVIGTAGVTMFPFLLPSSLDPDVSLTIWDASSSRTTLVLMTFVTAAVLPIVLLYTAWVLRVMRGKVTAAYIKEHGDKLY
ncbi:MAG: cytochrome d ubiquinol oxidase subunit II [Bdellovibrionales bacterium]